MTENALAQPYRPIRRVAPPDVPLPGVLATCAGDTVLLVESDVVPEALWRPDEPAHVWAPIDVARRGNAQAAVFPWCTATLDGYLRRRADAPIDGGEAVTLLVSLIRGYREAAADEAATGRWWVTGEGRPMFVPGEGSRLAPATLDAAEAVAGALADRAVSRLVAELPQVLAPPLNPGALDRSEQALFEAYAPKPLSELPDDTGAAVTLPDVRAQVAVPRTRAGDARGGRRRGDSHAGADGTLVSRALAALDAATTRIRTPSDEGRGDRSAGAAPARGSAAQGSRRRVGLVALSAAAAVIALGVMWPRGEPGQAAGDSGAAGAGSASVPASSESAPPRDTQSADERSSADPVVAARWLIAAAATCGDCGELAVSPAAAQAASELGEPTLVEDYGGIAVVRAAAASGGERFLVLERRDGQWWIREVSAPPG